VWKPFLEQQPLSSLSLSLSLFPPHVHHTNIHTFSSLPQLCDEGCGKYGIHPCAALAFCIIAVVGIVVLKMITIYERSNFCVVFLAVGINKFIEYYFY
jgi:hypothetical protein